MPFGKYVQATDVRCEFGGGHVSQSPLAAIHEYRSIQKAVVREEEPFLRTDAVVDNIEQVDANLELEEGVEVASQGRERGQPPKYFLHTLTDGQIWVGARWGTQPAGDKDEGGSTLRRMKQMGEVKREAEEHEGR